MFSTKALVLVVETGALEAIFLLAAPICYGVDVWVDASFFRLETELLLSSGSISAVFSMSFTGVVFMAPRMRRSPIFWTLSSLLMLVLAAVLQEVEAYTMAGLTAPV